MNKNLLQIKFYVTLSAHTQHKKPAPQKLSFCGTISPPRYAFFNGALAFTAFSGYVLTAKKLRLNLFRGRYRTGLSSSYIQRSPNFLEFSARASAIQTIRKQKKSDGRNQKCLKITNSFRNKSGYFLETLFLYSTIITYFYTYVNSYFHICATGSGKFYKLHDCGVLNMEECADYFRWCQTIIACR